MTALDLSSFDPATLAVYGALAILSVLALTVTFYKFFQFSHLGVGQSGDAEAILDDWLSGRPAEAMRAASERDTVLERVLQAVFSGLQARPDDKAYATELGRQTALIEMGMIQLRMRILETVVQAAPMLGLLGTVIGMINAFSTLASAEGAMDPALLAGGIYTALTTTALGLAIALVTYVVANWLESRIEAERQSIETCVSTAIHGRVDPSAGRS
ncbi:MAG: biopolymer transport protein ExbB [Halocynthiibacter sp.]|jgi:biopolymer transport protein ExbB